MGDDGSAAIGRVERAKISEPAGRNQHAAGVHANIARQVFQSAGQIEQLAHLFFILDAFLQLGFRLNRLGQRQRFILFKRNQFGKLVAEGIGQVEHAPDVADDRFGRHRPESGNLRNGVFAVFFAHVFDDASAFILTKIDVEVRHRHALRVEEALKQQGVAQRIQIGDADGEGHERTCARAAPRPDGDVIFFTPVDEVGHDQEVAGEAHFDDGLDLGAQAGVIGGALLCALRRIRV